MKLNNYENIKADCLHDYIFRVLHRDYFIDPGCIIVVVVFQY
jgi:hypothetical protein